MDPVTVIIEMSYFCDEENDDSLEGKLNDPHTAFSIPKEYIVDDIRVVDVDSVEVKGDLLAALLNDELNKTIVEIFNGDSDKDWTSEVLGA